MRLWFCCQVSILTKSKLQKNDVLAKGRRATDNSNLGFDYVGHVAFLGMPDFYNSSETFIRPLLWCGISLSKGCSLFEM